MFKSVEDKKNIFFYLRSAGSYKSDILPESSTNEYYLTVKYRKIYPPQSRDMINLVGFLKISKNARAALKSTKKQIILCIP